MAPHVLAGAEQLASLVEQASGMQAAGAGEPGLCETLRQIGEQLARHERARRSRLGVDRDLLERALAAHATGGARIEAAHRRGPSQRPAQLDRVRGELARQPELGRLVDQGLAV